MILFQYSYKGRDMEIKDIIDKIEELLYSKSMVIQLADYEVSDYDRGRIYGQIEMMNKIKMLAEGNDEEEPED